MSQDTGTEDVILSRKPESWDDFFSLVQNMSVPSDFLDESERNQVMPQPNPFEDWQE